VELKSILDQKPEQTAVAEALIDAYARVKPPRFSDSETVIFTYMRMFPKDPKWPTILGRLGERMQKWEKAIQGYEKASELARENRDLIIALFNAYKRADRPKAMTDYLAEKLSERQLERMPLQLASLGWAYFKIGQREKGLESFDRALLAAADDFVAYTTVISEMVSVIGLKEALERARNEVARDPNNIEKQKSLVHLLQYDKKPEEALKAAARVGELASREKDVIFAHLAQGMLLEQADRRPEAKPHYEAVLKIDAKQPIALNNMAFLLAEGMNNPSEALPYAQQAVRSDPNNADWLDTLGYVLMLNGRTGEAMGALLRAKDIERENPTILLHLGECQIKRGEKEEAQQWLRKAKDVAEKKGDKRVLPKIEKALTAAS
jgi:tetratricopeptide (TPR) repeat protein